MSKKIIISLVTLGVIAVIAVGGTIAYFSDMEKSTGNILVAGDVDLKVDHTWQIYNGVDCKTCDVKVYSDDTNMVVERNGVSMTPVAAKLVSNPHVRWTAQVAGCNPNKNLPNYDANCPSKWIWATDPTLPEDTYDTKYTFTKTFDWYGDFNGTSLDFSVGSDNQLVSTYMNECFLDDNTIELAYQNPVHLTIPATCIKQGQNTLKFIVNNLDKDNNHTPENNPGGLLYALIIDGKCEGNYFKSKCKLWELKDLVQGDTFWNFDDIKPGDWGKNKISLHVKSNDAYICAKNLNVKDFENACNESETEVDTTCDNPGEGQGELSSVTKVKAWLEDNTGDMVFDPSTETIVYDGLFKDFSINTVALTGNTTKYLILEWCVGDWGTDGKCNGAGVSNIAQTDSIIADLEISAIQQRNNPNFSCNPVAQ